ncbi:acylneuraminate cytidylyltransferase family protein [Acidobacteria bacterium AH-259-D05]|nr:acylneuraminate cytidylyltransferase family protein [Acidobacteria bacterium AH-259-D05]
MTTYAFVFARGGSKGVPGKNIRPLAGKPLLSYSIELARQIPAIQEIFVSTEDEQIRIVAIEWGAKVIPRPPELAQDDSPEWQAWRHAVDWVKNEKGNFDVFVSLPATSPLRNIDDVEACLNRIDDETDMVVTITDTSRSPWFNMVRQTEDGYARLLIEGEERYARRQDVPQAFDMSTVAYVTRPDFIRKANGVFEGRVKAVKIPDERALDIDTELDFQIAEFLMEKRHSKTMELPHVE